jgi:hypothetical protein
VARGPWRRDPGTGLTPAESDRIDEAYLTPEGKLDLSRFRDCNLFRVNSATAAAFGPGVNVSRTAPAMLTDPRFHHYTIPDPDGRRVTVATHVNSAAAYGELVRSENEHRRRANLWQGPTTKPFSLSGRMGLSTASANPARKPATNEDSRLPEALPRLC